MSETNEGPNNFDSIFKSLRLLPEFDGNPNVLTRFINLCDNLVATFRKNNNDLDNLALLNGILNKVTGPAARFINANGIPEDWQGVRTALINNFSDQRDETSLYNDLSLLNQGQSTPQEFYERCQNLFSTIMTYVSLHEDIPTTVQAKRELYKKLTLQSYLRGLKDPLGSRIRCMRPETIEKALEFVQEELNTLYLQQRNDSIPDRKVSTMFNANQKPMTTHSMSFMPPIKSTPFNMPGPSQMPPPQFHAQQWKPAPASWQLSQGPSRTQQMFRAVPPNYNQQQNAFRMSPRNPNPGLRFSAPPPRPMSGVSHVTTRALPPSSFATGHNYFKSGNPPPTNYFKAKELNFNECYDYDNNPCEYYEEYHYPEGEYYYEEPYPQHTDPYVYEQVQYKVDYPQEADSSEPQTCSKDEDFQRDVKSNKRK